MIKRNYIVFGLACLALLTALFLYQWSIDKRDEYTGWVTHTQEVIIRFEKLGSDIKSVQIFPASIRLNHSNKVLQYDSFDEQSVHESLAVLKTLTKDNHRQGKRLDTLVMLVNQHLDKIMQRDPVDQTASLNGLMIIQYHIDKGVEMEKMLLARRKSNMESSQRTTGILRMLLMGTGVLVILISSLSSLLQRFKRNRAENSLSSVLNTSPTGILACEAIRDKDQIKDFKVLFSNHALRKQMELKDGEVMKQTLTGISPSTVKIGTFDKYVRVTDTGEPVEFEVSLKRSTKLRWFQIFANKLNDGFIASYSDITDLKNSEQQLIKKVAELQQINSELEQFAYVASHDLQEPLRKIKTFSSLVIEHFNDPDASFAKLYLNKVTVAANRMSTLINDLLNFSALSDQSQQFVQTDLNNIWSSICNDFELKIEEKGAEITCGGLHPVEAVPLQMNQLFYNLLNNALKFTRANAPARISVSARLLSKEEAAGYPLDPELRYQQIEVKDNGIGFNPEYAKKIFVIFQRLNSKELFSGTGIGLALCQKIVSNHHGYIYAESKENEGARFYVILPLHQHAAIVQTNEQA